MKLEYQCVSLPLAKRLRELGVKQSSLFYWRDYNSDAGSELIFAPNVFHEKAFTVYDYYSAFTVAELGVLLPESWQYNMIRFDRKEGAFEGEIMDDKYYQIDSLETDCRAKMLIYLLENGLLK